MPKKKPGSIVTLKNGARAKVLPSGRYRFISGPTKRKGTKRKGGSAMVGGAARKKRGGSARIGGGLGLGKHLRKANPGVYDAVSAAGRFILH